MAFHGGAMFPEWQGHLRRLAGRPGAVAVAAVGALLFITDSGKLYRVAR